MNNLLLEEELSGVGEAVVASVSSGVGADVVGALVPFGFQIFIP